MDQSEIIQIVDEDEQKELKEEFQIELIEKIDEGSFGVVFKGRDLSDGSHCAVKVTQNNKEKYSSIETSILRGLDHPNIVKFKKFIELEWNKYIVMEYIGCGTLYQLIEERKALNQPFTESEISTIMNHLVSALKSMHENNVLHRDIKPENILLGSKEDLSLLKLSDFGLSVKYQDGVPFKSYSQKCGTVIFMAPEILAEKQYSKPVDIWSCGIILYMLFTMGKHPFKSYSDSRDEYTKKLINLDLSKEEFDEDAFPSELAKDLFMRMLNKEPSNRYTASQVLKHPFITRKLNSNIPLSFQEQARVFQNQRKLSQTMKAILILQYIQQKSAKQQENIAKHTPTPKIKQIPVKYKTYDEKDSPSTERSGLLGNRKFLRDLNSNEEQPSKEIQYMESAPNFDDKRQEDSPQRQFRLNSNKLNDRSLLSEKLPSHKTVKLKLAIPTFEQKQNKPLHGQVKSLNNSPIQPNSAQSKDGQSPQFATKGQVQGLQSQQMLITIPSFTQRVQVLQIKKGKFCLQSIKGKIITVINQHLYFLARKTLINSQLYSLLAKEKILLLLKSCHLTDNVHKELFNNLLTILPKALLQLKQILFKDLYKHQTLRQIKVAKLTYQTQINSQENQVKISRLNQLLILTILHRVLQMEELILVSILLQEYQEFLMMLTSLEQINNYHFIKSKTNYNKEILQLQIVKYHNHQSLYLNLTLKILQVPKNLVHQLDKKNLINQANFLNKELKNMILCLPKRVYLRKHSHSKASLIIREFQLSLERQIRKIVLNIQNAKRAFEQSCKIYFEDEKYSLKTALMKITTNQLQRQINKLKTIFKKQIRYFNKYKH